MDNFSVYVCTILGNIEPYSLFESMGAPRIQIINNFDRIHNIMFFFIFIMKKQFSVSLTNLEMTEEKKLKKGMKNLQLVIGLAIVCKFRDRL